MTVKNDGYPITSITDEHGDQQGGIREILVTMRHGEIYADVTMIGYFPTVMGDVQEMVGNTTLLDLDLRDVIVRSVNVETAYSSDWDNKKEERLKL